MKALHKLQPYLVTGGVSLLAILALNTVANRTRFGRSARNLIQRGL